MFANKLLLRFFPFLAWFPVNSVILRGDLIAGITGGLVLVPKAMAYAQLSGLPVYYGLYVALVPAVLGALWGSSRQLATGPVAIVSLMTAAAIAPLAVPFSDDFVGLALLLALMVGVIQFALGALKLGTIVNFVSHPVILGFMNAAAIIIALSQLDMLLGIPKGRSDSFVKDIWEMMAYVPQTHLPTLAMSAFALALMLVLKKIKPLSKPSVLVAVVITTLVSYYIGFAHNTKARVEDFANAEVAAAITGYINVDNNIRDLSAEITAHSSSLRSAQKARDGATIADIEYQIDMMRIGLANLEAENKGRLKSLALLKLERGKAPEGQYAAIHLAGEIPAGTETDGRSWHVKKIEKGEVRLVGGGDVVGNIPAGLPSFRLPPLGLDAILSLFSAALIIALVAFMESISMAKAMAATTKDKIDPNQELIGQGLANLVGSLTQSFPVSGSFSRSAVNINAGARTGMSSVITAAFVLLTLLFLTPLLYHLPQAVLAAIIIMAVIGLINFGAVKHAWQANRHDGIASVVTFVATLAAAPHLDKGIMIGAGLAIVLYLYRTMTPRVAILGRHPDGNLRDAAVHSLPPSQVVTAVRFDGRLYFANVAFFEDAILEAVAANPDAPYLLIVGDGINELDASGEEVVRHLVQRLRAGGTTVLFSGLKKQVIDVMRATGLFDNISQAHIFATADMALAAIHDWAAARGEGDAASPLQPLPVKRFG